MYAIVERLAEMLGLMNMTTKCGKYSNKAHLHRLPTHLQNLGYNALYGRKAARTSLQSDQSCRCCNALLKQRNWTHRDAQPRKSKYIRFQRKVFELHLRCFLLVVVVLLVVAQVRDQLIQAMRNSDPRVRIVFVYGLNSDFHSIFTLKAAGCNFQYGSNLGVPSNPTFRVR